jgi:carboxyl-terminal processing protease
MFKKARFYLIILCFIAIIAGFIAGAGTVSFIKALPNENYEKLALLSKALHIVESTYVEPIAVEKLIYGAIRGMLEELDPHSVFLTPDAYKQLRSETSGKFGGLGIEITKKDNILTVISPIEDTPAWKAGIKSLDQIIKINDEPTREMDLQIAVNKMRGKPGTKVKITVMRKGHNTPLDYTLTRETITAKPVKSVMLDDNYGYLKLSSFTEQSAADIRKAISTLTESSKGGLKGLVMDLRNNPGGLLDQAVAVADIFLDKGVIVSVIGRDKTKKSIEYAKPAGTILDLPLVVLVNEASASASEIVAGALQDQKRALIVGQKTFGKGSVQTIVELDDKTAIKYTIARYYTPSGRSIQAKGIEPDLTVLPIDPSVLADEKKVEEFYKTEYAESALKGHFENDQVDKKAKEKDNDETSSSSFRDDISKIYEKARKALDKRNNKDTELTKVANLDYDYQLREAYNYLKAYSMGKVK